MGVCGPRSVAASSGGTPSVPPFPAHGGVQGMRMVFVSGRPPGLYVANWISERCGDGDGWDLRGQSLLIRKLLRMAGYQI